MRPTLCLIVLAMLAARPLAAQHRKPQPARQHARHAPAHQLLWEISGNGIEKPSYLYGTMHVQDVRAFEFSDSVLARFHACTTFASEVRLDSAIRELMYDLMPDAESDAVPEADEADDVEADTSMSVAGDADDADQAGDMEAAASDSTSPDAEIPGERFVPPVIASDTAGMTVDSNAPDSFSSDEREPPSKPPSRSGAGRHSKRPDIWDNPLMSDMFDGETVHRVSDRPVVLDSYLTALALREGKQVIGLESTDEQLEAAKSIRPKLPKLFGSRLKKHATPEALVADDMITYYRAGDIEAVSRLLIEALSPETYATLIVQRNYHMAERAERYIRQAPTFIAVGAGHLAGARGVIQLLRDRGFTVRPVTATFTGLADTYVQPPRLSNWPTFTSEKGAFKVQMPMEPVKLGADHSLGAAANGTLYIWPDLLGGVTYMASSGDYEVGRLASPADAILHDAFQTITASVLRVMGHPTPITVDSLPGLEFLTHNTDGKYRRTQLVLRGNRLYKLVAESTRELMHSEDAEQFFGSFHVLDFNRGDWRADTVRACECSLLAPVRLQRQWGPYEGYTGARMSYTARDANNGLRYTLGYTHFNKYYHADAADSIIAGAMEDQRFDDDTVTTATDVTRGGIAGREYESVSGAMGLRARVVLVGDRLYHLMVRMPAAMLHDSGAGRFFDSFRPLGEIEAVDLYSDKSSKVLTDMLSPDTVVAKRACDAAWGYPFTERHLPAIYKVLEAPPAGDTAVLAAAKRALLGRLGSLHDANSVNVIRDHCPPVNGDWSLQSAAMQALSRIGTDEALAALADLVLRDTAAAEGHGNGNVLYMLDLDNGAKIAPRVLPIIHNADYRDGIYYLALELLDSGRIARTELTPYAARIIRDCALALRESRRESDDEASDDDESGDADTVRTVHEEDALLGDDAEPMDGDDEPRYVTSRLRSTGGLLGYLPYTPDIDNLLRGLMGSHDIDVATTGATAYVRQSGTPPAPVLERLAADPASRLTLYRTLDEQGHAQVFPARYHTQRAFAQSVLYEWLSEEEDEDDVPDSIAYVAQRSVTTGDHPGRIYMFKFRYGSDAPWQIAISGTQPLDETQVATSSDMVRSNYETLDSRTIDEHFDVLMRSR